MIKVNEIIMGSSFEGLTKKIPQEDIFSKYLEGGIAVNVFSPFRKTTKKTCGFYKTDGNILMLHDFSTGQK